jgi:hypothetical protein
VALPHVLQSFFAHFALKIFQKQSPQYLSPAYLQKIYTEQAELPEPAKESHQMHPDDRVAATDLMVHRLLGWPGSTRDIVYFPRTS